MIVFGLVFVESPEDVWNDGVSSSGFTGLERVFGLQVQSALHVMQSCMWAMRCIWAVRLTGTLSFLGSNCLIILSSPSRMTLSFGLSWSLLEQNKMFQGDLFFFLAMTLHPEQINESGTYLKLAQTPLLHFSGERKHVRQILIAALFRCCNLSLGDNAKNSLQLPMLWVWPFKMHGYLGTVVLFDLDSSLSTPFWWWNFYGDVSWW